ncbi:MAG: hypothetical protein KDK65_03640 [Chlamydiia bacterium]|nr:hypothetical protein [Chlamydiia bacterium]
MAKTNFTKVEQALVEGLKKMEKEQLLQIADEANAAKKLPSNERKIAVPAARRLALASLKEEIRILQKHKVKFFREFGLSKRSIDDLIKEPASLKPEQWQQIKEIRDKISTFHRKLRDQLPKQSNDDLVEAERKKHINKRFNIDEEWLPLQ